MAKKSSPKLFDDGEGNPPKPKLREVKSFKTAKAQLVDPEQVWMTDYRSEYCDKLIEMASKGLSVRAFAATIEVGYSTLYRWAAEIPEFKHAMDVAEMKRHLFYEVTALRNISNREFNTPLFTRLAQTIGRWRDEDERPQVEGQSAEHIDPSLMTAEQRRKRILELTKDIQNG